MAGASRKKIEFQDLIALEKMYEALGVATDDLQTLKDLHIEDQHHAITEILGDPGNKALARLKIFLNSGRDDSWDEKKFDSNLTVLEHLKNFFTLLIEYPFTKGTSSTYILSSTISYLPLGEGRFEFLLKLLERPPTYDDRLPLNLAIYYLHYHDSAIGLSIERGGVGRQRKRLERTVNSFLQERLGQCFVDAEDAERRRAIEDKRNVRLRKVVWSEACQGLAQHKFWWLIVYWFYRQDDMERSRYVRSLAAPTWTVLRGRRASVTEVSEYQPLLTNGAVAGWITHYAWKRPLEGHPQFLQNLVGVSLSVKMLYDNLHIVLPKLSNDYTINLRRINKRLVSYYKSLQPLDELDISVKEYAEECRRRLELMTLMDDGFAIFKRLLNDDTKLGLRYWNDIQCFEESEKSGLSTREVGELRQKCERDSLGCYFDRVPFPSFSGGDLKFLHGLWRHYPTHRVVRSPSRRGESSATPPPTPSVDRSGAAGAAAASAARIVSSSSLDALDDSGGGGGGGRRDHHHPSPVVGVRRALFSSPGGVGAAAAAGVTRPATADIPPPVDDEPVADSGIFRVREPQMHFASATCATPTRRAVEPARADDHDIELEPISRERRRSLG